MRLLVTPERMFDLSQQMCHEADRVCGIESRLGSALASLDWEVRHQSNVKGRINTARGQTRAL